MPAVISPVAYLPQKKKTKKKEKKKKEKEKKNTPILTCEQGEIYFMLI